MIKLCFLLALMTLFQTSSSNSNNCLTGCQECVEPKSFCISCKNDFELSSSGECIANTIPNCSKYENRLICSRCRPSFRLLNNRCIKMNDGCMESSPFNICSNCIENGILDKITSTCLTNELNCQQLGRNRRCINCKEGYRLDSSKNICVFNSSICSKTDENTGLCAICAQNFTLVGFDCFRTQKARTLTNCYLATENSTSSTLQCIYCKEGYLLINGMCMVRSFIIEGNKRINCSETSEYIDVNDSSCKPVPKNCKFFDYGFKKCAFCQNGRTLLGGICRKDIQKNCRTFSSKNPELCETCKEKYYLNQDSECMIYPAFCEEVSSKGKCLRCMNTFLLTTNFLCVDPNCFQINQFSGQCNQCKSNFVKNVEGICVFVDLNCDEKKNQICVKCKENFQPNNQTGICEFRDPNCALFSSKNVCLQCNQMFYYNINAQRCLKMPDNCQLANERGQCRQCVMGYVLTSSRECVKTNPIPNCKVSNLKSPELCSQCQIRYYLTLKGTCQLLPLFCLDFDASKNQCKTCDLVRSRLEDGMCKDKNCQYMDFDGTCLGCFQDYEFGSRGECQPVEKDPNCKEFFYDQCRKCSDKFYFDKSWKCVPVSSLCKEYDENSGLCTSCYPGYRLSEEPEGQCIIGDPIFNPCKEQDNKTGDCIKCADGYELAKTDTNKIVCTKIDTNLANSCLQFKNKKCSRCIASRFLKDGQCEQIDQKCMKYNNLTGQCQSCYEGYELKVISKIATNQTKQVCLYKAPNDPNCKTFDKNHSSLCVECYSGYQVSSQTNKCELFQDFCQTRNQLNQCIACFLGYKLINNVCVVSPQNSSKLDELVLPIQGCEIPNSLDNKLCEQCEWGYLKMEGICWKKDENCRVFKDGANSLECLECYPGYSLMPNNHNVCALQSKIDKNCQQYDGNNSCIKCKTGFKLSVSSLQNTPKCESANSDINCAKYNQLGVCEQCLVNMIVAESGKCQYPLYGFDLNCQQYKNRICVKCKDNFVLNLSFICALKE